MEQSADVPAYDPALAEVLREGDGGDEIAVIVRLSGDHALLPCARVVTRFGDIATLRVRRDCIAELAASEAVSAVESSLGLSPEPAFDEGDVGGVALAERSAEITSASAYSRRPEGVVATGRGVVVGVLDWGCDFAHPAFRNADDSTRFLAIWDQRGETGGPDNRWGYGRIIARAEIDEALHTGDPYGALDYEPARADSRDPESGRWMGAHGTHVCAIAAGSEYDGGMSGVAPGADLVFVDLARTEDVLGRGNLGDSVTVLEALDFIFTIAGDRPCVVNMSIGAHGGPHDGSTLVELGIDRAVWLARGRAVVNSGGNYYNARGHAEGRLRTGGEDRLRIRVPPADPTESEIELWYSGADRFTARVIDPGGAELAVVRPGENRPLLREGVIHGHIYHVLNATNREHHIDIFLRPHAPAGTWELRLSGDVVQDGRYHAWIERERGPRPRFVSADATSTCTTGTVCNGRLSITVGAFDPHHAGWRMGSFSSAGPTRDGRMKPELCAPGVRIRAARSRSPGSAPAAYHTTKSGTSMAAPHVTGAVALMFEAAGAPLDISDTRALLFASADRIALESAALTGIEVHRFGSGFLNIAAAEWAAREWAGTDHDETAAATEHDVQANDAQEATMTFEPHDASTPAWNDATAEADADAAFAAPYADFAAPDAAPLDELDAESLQDDAGCGCGHGDIVADAEAAFAAAYDETLPEAEDTGDAPLTWEYNEQYDDTWSSAESADDVAEIFDDIDPIAIVLRELVRTVTESARPFGGADILHEAAFDALGVPNDAPLTPIALAAQPLTEPVRAGDLLVRSDPSVGVLHSAIVLSDGAEDAVSIAVRGVPVERAGPGAYVEVMESRTGAAPQVIGRRLTDSWGRMPRGQTLLRPPRTGGGTAFDSASSVYTLDDVSELDAALFVEQAAAVDWCATRTAIAAAARAEVARWRRPDGSVLRESDASQLAILTEYWTRVPGFSAAAAAQAATQSSTGPAANRRAWSAAFICFVMHAAGVRAAHGFQFGERHMDYIVGALRNRERSDRTRPFWLADHIELRGEARAAPGDLLCFNRPDNGVMTRHSYNSLRNAFWSGGNQNRPARGASHCSIVVGTVDADGRRFLETVGGNEGDTVLVRRVPLDSGGAICDPERHNLFGMIRLIGC